MAREASFWFLLALLAAIGVASANDDDWTVLKSNEPDAVRQAALTRVLGQKASKPRLTALLRGPEGPSIAKLCAHIPSGDTADVLLPVLRSPNRPSRIAAARALGAHWAIRKRVAPLLAEHLQRVAVPEEVREVLRALVRLRDRSSTASLVDAAQGKHLEALAGVFDPSYRRDILQVLVSRLPDSLGSLRRLTGQDFDLDAVAWRAWIVAQPPVSKPRDGGVPAPNEPKGADGPTFFGLTLSRTDVVLLLDASRSMQDAGRFARVQHAASAVLSALGSVDRFNLVFFSDAADPFRKRLVQADARTRELALRFIARRKTRGGTDLGAGLRAALRDQRVKEIVLFTDGLPTRGRVTTARDALRLLGKRKVRIHVVVAGSGAATEFFELARQTGGRTVVVR